MAPAAADDAGVEDCAEVDDDELDADADELEDCWLDPDPYVESEEHPAVVAANI